MNGNHFMEMGHGLCDTLLDYYIPNRENQLEEAEGPDGIALAGYTAHSTNPNAKRVMRFPPEEVEEAADPSPDAGQAKQDDDGDGKAKQDKGGAKQEGEAGKCQGPGQGPPSSSASSSPKASAATLLPASSAAPPSPEQIIAAAAVDADGSPSNSKVLAALMGEDDAVVQRRASRAARQASGFAAEEAAENRAGGGVLSLENDEDNELEVDGSDEEEGDIDSGGEEDDLALAADADGEANRGPLSDDEAEPNSPLFSPPNAGGAGGVPRGGAAGSGASGASSGEGSGGGAGSGGGVPLMVRSQTADLGALSLGRLDGPGSPDAPPATSVPGTAAEGAFVRHFQAPAAGQVTPLLQPRVDSPILPAAVAASLDPIGGPGGGPGGDALAELSRATLPRTVSAELLLEGTGGGNAVGLAPRRTSLTLGPGQGGGGEGQPGASPAGGLSYLGPRLGAGGLYTVNSSTARGSGGINSDRTEPGSGGYLQTGSGGTAGLSVVGGGGGFTRRGSAGQGLAAVGGGLGGGQLPTVSGGSFGGGGGGGGRLALGGAQDEAAKAAQGSRRASAPIGRSSLSAAGESLMRAPSSGDNDSHSVSAAGQRLPTRKNSGGSLKGRGSGSGRMKSKSRK